MRKREAIVVRVYEWEREWGMFLNVMLEQKIGNFVFYTFSLQVIKFKKSDENNIEIKQF